MRVGCSQAGCSTPFAWKAAQVTKPDWQTIRRGREEGEEKEGIMFEVIREYRSFILEA